MTRVTRNIREKYSQINITWWENWRLHERYGFPNAYWWLRDVISFKAGDDPIKIPLGEAVEEENLNTEVKTIFTNRGNESSIEPKFATSTYELKKFPRIGDYRTSHVSDFDLSVFGEDDKINVTKSEFYNAGGSVTIEWDVETYQHYVLFQPPSSNIGTNENFSITLEGSIPAMFLSLYGYMLVKRETTFYTEFYGKTNNVLELEYEFVTEKHFLYQVAQRLLEKYSYGSSTYSVDYYQEDIPITDNKPLIPQSVTIDLNGKRSTSDAFIYNRLDSIPQKPLGELGSAEHTLNDVQFYPYAFLT